MAVLPAFLPLIAFWLSVVALANARPAWGWDKAFLRGVIYFGAYAVVAAEILGLFHAITQLGLATAWILPMVAGGAWLVRHARRQGLRPWRLPRLAPAEWVFVLIVALVVGTTAVIALLAPPNTWDSLSYHMARVAHWAQSGSLGHYATGIERQNLMPPGAEIGMLQAYVLGRGDRLTNFPQWFAMAACVVAAVAIARRLGSTRVGQLFAAAFVATLPMGIAQASSTMTDYVEAVWVACVAFETVGLLVDDDRGRPDFVPMALAVGLAVLAKPTAFAYVAPLGLLVAVLILQRFGLRRLIVSTGIVVAVVLVLNVGYLGRNIATYGNPLGSSGKLETHANEILDGRVVLSNLLRNASLHAGTSFEPLNDFVMRAVVWTHLKLGMGLSDPRTTVHSGFQIGPPSRDEKNAGNPYHAIVTLVAAATLVAASLRHRRPRRTLLYGALVVLTFVLLSSMIKFTIFASRYHTAFFVLLAPAVGYEVGRWRVPWLAAALAVALAWTSLPILLHLNERPLLEDRDGYSLLASPRQSMYFTTGHFLEYPYTEIARAVQVADCRAVGLMLTGDAAEYPLWPLLGEPAGKTRLEWIVAGTPSARYSDASFAPCAVVCDASCPAAWQDVRRLPLALDVTGFRLYLAPKP